MGAQCQRRTQKHSTFHMTKAIFGFSGLRVIVLMISTLSGLAPSARMNGRKSSMLKSL